MAQDKEKVNTDKTDKKQYKPWQFKAGQSGNPAGRPKGALSPITRVRQIFEDNPDSFDKFVKEYMEDPNNRKHLVEMLDGKPRQNVQLEGGEKPIPLIQINAIPRNNSSKEDTTA